MENMRSGSSELNSKSTFLSGGKSIPENSDMNTYLEPGNYYMSYTEGVLTLKNCPFEVAFTLKISYAVGNDYPCQTFREYNTSRIAYRVYNPYAETWSKFEYFTSDELLPQTYSLSGVGWKRILKFETGSSSAAGGSYGYGGLIVIRTAYSNDANMYNLISFASRYYVAAQSNFLKLHGIGNEVITKIRHTVDSNTNTAYIEVYYNSSRENRVNIDFLSNSSAMLKTNKWKPTSGESTDETVDGVTVVSTLDLIGS